MSKYFQICRFPYSSDMIFDLVSDVKKYPEFLPWCKGVEVHKRSRSILIATVFVGDGIFCYGLEQMLPLFHKSLSNLFEYCLCA